MRARSVAGVCALALAVVWAAGAGGPASGASMSSAMAGLPPLSIVSPVTDARVKNPVSLVLETTGDLAKLTMGEGMNVGGAGGMGPSVHLHMVVDTHILMPVVSQFANAGKNRYRYTLSRLSSGQHTIKVYWADDKTHESVGPIHTVTFTVIG